MDTKEAFNQPLLAFFERGYVKTALVGKALIPR